MNKLLTLTALLGTGCLCFGQGYVQFQNGSTTKISTNSVVGGPATGAIAPVPGSYYFALFVGTATQTNVDSNFTGWTFVALGTNTAVLGRFWGNNTVSWGVNCVAVPGVCGGISNFVILGWSANLGSNWHTAQAELANYQAHGGVSGPGEWIGLSHIGTNSALSCPSNPANTIIGDYGGLIPGFTLGLYPVRPATLANAKKLPNGAFQFGYTGNGLSYSVYASTNQTQWELIGPAAQISPGVYQFTDTNATNYQKRFYKLRSP